MATPSGASPCATAVNGALELSSMIMFFASFSTSGQSPMSFQLTSAAYEELDDVGLAKRILPFHLGSARSAQDFGTSAAGTRSLL